MIMNPEEQPRRVVITGMGVIAPNGKDLDTFWRTVCEGKSSADYVTRFDVSAVPSKFACEIRDFNPSDYMDAKTARRLERSLHYGIAAARLALLDSKLDFSLIDPDRTGIVEGSSLSNVESAYKGKDAIAVRGYRSISPSAMISGYVGSGSAEVAHQLGIKGHAITCSSSSASGNDVMGYAMSMIQNEDVDVMVSGGAEAPLVDTIYYGFSQSRAISHAKDYPKQAMKPFDVESDGFVMGEGGAYVVLEELTHALSRGARIYAELLGQGRSCEAYHPMAPHPEGAGVKRAMEKCLRRAGVDVSSVQYINVHGTANEVSDLAEVRAIRKFFGNHVRNLAVSSTKPVTGHPLAAAGAIETVICALALEHQVIPMTLNLATPRAECDLDFVTSHSRPYPLQTVMSLNSGFGGKTSCLLLGRYSV